MVSIIIYAYNAESYITECIKSILSQTYENFEIVIVDDASSDATAITALQLADEDDRIQVYGHVKRQGTANANNTGMYHASGDYFMFLNSSDIMKPNALNSLITAAKRYNADLVIGNADITLKSQRFAQSNWKNQKYNKPKKDDIIGKNFHLEDSIYVDGKISNCVCIPADVCGNKLWKAAVISKYDIKFQDECFESNIVFYHYMLAKCKTVATIHNVILSSYISADLILDNVVFNKKSFDLITNNYKNTEKQDYIKDAICSELVCRIKNIQYIPWYEHYEQRKYIFTLYTKDTFDTIPDRDEEISILLKTYEKLKRRKFLYTFSIPVLIYRHIIINRQRKKEGN